MRKQRYPSAKYRLLSNILKVDSGCWEWQGTTQGNGYGSIRGFEKKSISTHRLSYLIHKGEIPPNKMVCHTCDNPICVNPDHLFLGSNSDNMQDCYRKGRSKNSFEEGHKSSRRMLSDEQVVKIKQSISNLHPSIPLKDIAFMHGVSHDMVRNIYRKKTYKDI